MTKTEKLLSVLQSGTTLSATAITKLTGLQNPRQAVADLRRAGHCVYTNKDGYRLGTPTKRMVALANHVAGAAVFKG